ncbi:MAG TPA: hypothetical protein ENK85_11770 [Saprospiraceae bacterium]|nr:hypothetical protein [Saprospiraceae bacterium]
MPKILGTYQKTIKYACQIGLQGGFYFLGRYLGLWGAPSSLLVFGAQQAAFGLWGATSCFWVWGAVGCFWVFGAQQVAFGCGAKSPAIDTNNLISTQTKCDRVFPNFLRSV